MKGKTAVYSWRVAPDTKGRLEEAARRTGRSVAEVLDEIVTDRLVADDRATSADAGRQSELHARAARFAGRLSGGDPHRSARVRTNVRARLAARRRRAG
jgi:hypothetical protein